MPNKICSRCKEEKPFGRFHKNKSKGGCKNGFSRICIPCSAIKSKAWRKNNKEKLRKKQSEYYNKNKERIREKERLRRLGRHADQRAYDIAQSKAYYNKNKEEILQKEHTRRMSRTPDQRAYDIAQSKAYYNKNKEEIKRKQHQKWHNPIGKEERLATQRQIQRNRTPEQVKRDSETKKKWSHKHRERLLAEKKQWYLENKEHHQALSKIWRQNNKERKAAMDKAFRSRPEVRKRIAARQRERIKTEPAFRLGKLVSDYIRKGLLGQNLSKKSSIWKKLPYNSHQLKEHIEKQFEPWMTWENHGNGLDQWSLGHKIPRAALTYGSMDDPYFTICWSLENLFPQNHLENVSMGSVYKGKRYSHNGPNIPLNEIEGGNND